MSVLEYFRAPYERFAERVRGTDPPSTTVPSKPNGPSIRAYHPTLAEQARLKVLELGKRFGTDLSALADAANFAASVVDPTSVGRTIHDARRSVARARSDPNRRNITNAIVDTLVSAANFAPGPDVGQSLGILIGGAAKTFDRPAAAKARIAVHKANLSRPIHQQPSAQVTQTVVRSTDPELKRAQNSFYERKSPDIPAGYDPLQDELWDSYNSFYTANNKIGQEIHPQSNKLSALVDELSNADVLQSYRLSDEVPVVMGLSPDQRILYDKIVDKGGPQVGPIVPLENILNFDELYAAYPSMRSLPVYLNYNPKAPWAASAHYFPPRPNESFDDVINKAFITLHPPEFDHNKALLFNALMHEIQHHINRADFGFFTPRFSSPLLRGERAYWQSADEVMARNAELRDMQAIERQAEYGAPLPSFYSPARTESFSRAQQILEDFGNSPLSDPDLPVKLKNTSEPNARVKRGVGYIED